MKTLDKIEKLIKIGYTADLENGIIYNSRNRPVSRKSSDGYICISVVNNDDKKTYNVKGHQFIFYMKHGYIPKLIDHIDENKLNNKISNLRPSNKSLNGLNISNSKGYTKHRGKYMAQIMIDYKNKYLGLYNTPEEASKAYITEKQKYIL